MTMPQYKKPVGWPKPVVDCSGDVPLTTQSEARELDINRIVARIQKGLSVPLLNGQPFYGDVSMFDGLQDAIMKVQEADELFMAYPADLREKFGNDPVQMVEFLSDPKNLDEAVKMGLAAKKPEKAPEAPGTTPAVPGQPA